MLTEYLTAYTYELEAAGRIAQGRVGGSGVGSVGLIEAGHRHLTNASMVKKVGDGVKRVATIVTKFPVITWQADFMATRHGADELSRRFSEAVEADRHDLESALTAVQLVEAVERMRQERASVRAATLLVNPVSGAASIAAGAAVKASGEPSTRRLLRYADRVVADQPKCFEHYLICSRVCLSSGRPQKALEYAMLAAALAGESGLSAPKAAGWGKVTRAIRSNQRPGSQKRSGSALRGSLSPSHKTPDDQEQVEKRVGAALYAAGLAYLKLGQPVATLECSVLAIRAGNTLGYDLQARLLTPSGRSLRRRATLSGNVNKVDRLHYLGSARKDLGTMVGTARGQTKRTATLVRDLASLFRS